MIPNLVHLLHVLEFDVRKILSILNHLAIWPIDIPMPYFRWSIGLQSMWSTCENSQAYHICRPSEQSLQCFRWFIGFSVSKRIVKIL